MFSKVCSLIRNGIYVFFGISPGKNRISPGTAFMIRPGIIVTAGHLVFLKNDASQPMHEAFNVLRASDVSRIVPYLAKVEMEKVHLLEVDPERDLAIFNIYNSKSSYCLTLSSNVAPVGSVCGLVGFPFTKVKITQEGVELSIVERFQSAHICSFYEKKILNTSRLLSFYETDNFMYDGSSGCPGFLKNGNIFGMHIGSYLKEISPDIEKNRLPFSLWVPSTDIIAFARGIGVY